MVQGEKLGADIWKELPGFGGKYRINSHGVVEHVYKNGSRGIVKPVVKRGRLVIRLTFGGRRVRIGHGNGGDRYGGNGYVVQQ